MNELLGRAGAFFVERPASRILPAPVPAPSCAGVLAPEAELAAAAGWLAAALRSRHGSRTAVVCLAGEGGPPVPPLPAASALARRLGRRDIAATAAGALCRVRLPGDAGDFARGAWRVLGAVDVPVVVAVARREGHHDELLAALDLLALATPGDAPPALAEVAAAGLEALGPPVARLTLPRGAGLRRAAAAGLLRAPLPALVTA